MPKAPPPLEQLGSDDNLNEPARSMSVRDAIELFTRLVEIETEITDAIPTILSTLAAARPADRRVFAEKVGPVDGALLRIRTMMIHDVLAKIRAMP
jgi:hypothetical protein